MRLKVQKIISILLLLVLTAYITPYKVFAAADASISADSTNIKVNETTQIKVSVSSAEAWNLALSSTGGNLSGKLDDARASGGQEESTTVMTASFSSSTPGEYKITLTGSIASPEDYNNKTTHDVAKSITINVSANEEQNTNPQEWQGGDSGNAGGNSGSTETPTGPTQDVPQETNPTPTTPQEPTKSSNNYLSSLSVSIGTLTPEFSRERLEYSLEFEEDFDFNTLNTVTVQALAEDSRSKVGGTGEANVITGENIIEIDVMAEDSSVRTYKISFIKPEVIQQSDLRLSSLVINTVDEKGKTKEVELTPKFDKEIFDYKLEVTKDIEKLEVNGQVENENIVVSIDGADTLHTGKNLVKITLTSPTDENIKSVYQITVNKEDPLFNAANENVELKEKNRKRMIMGLVLGIIAVLATVLVILLVINHRKNEKEKAGHEDDEEYDKYNKKPDEEELEEKKKKLFDYDDEDTYLTDEKLEKLSDEYKATADEIEKDEKEKNESFDKLAGLMESKRLNADEEEETEENVESKDEDTEIKEDEVLEEDYDKDDEARAKKLAELEKEIKDKRKKITKTNEKEEFDKDDFLNDIKNKKSED